MKSGQELKFTTWDASVALPSTPVPFTVYIIRQGTNFTISVADETGTYLSQGTVVTGVQSVSGDGVDNTDSANPVLSFPISDEIDDSSSIQKFVTQAFIDKLNGIQSGAEVNVNSDWNAVLGDALILNKPTTTGEFTNDGEGSDRFVEEQELGTAAYEPITNFATSAQGTLADSAIQPGDNISELVNDAGYVTDSGVDTVTGDGVDNTDPKNPSLTFPNANQIPFAPTGNTTSTDVQAAIEELQIDIDTVNPNAAGNEGEVQFNSSNLFAADNNLFWDNTNKRLGIGNSSPDRKLHVGSASPSLLGDAVAAIVDNYAGVSGVVMGNKNTGNTSDFRFLIEDTTNHYFTFAVPSINNSQSALFGVNRNEADYIFSSGGTARTMAIGTLQSEDVVLGTNNLNRITIKSDGDVGIGTNLPLSKLDVRGVISGGTNSPSASKGVTLDLSSSTLTRDAAAFNFKQFPNKNLTFQIASVVGTDDIFFQHDGNDGNGNFIIEAFRTDGLVLETFGSGGIGEGSPIIFSPDRIEAMRVLASGNLAVGQATASEKIEVNGNVLSDSHITNGGTADDFVTGTGSLDSTVIRKGTDSVKDIKFISALTRAEYNALGTVDPETVYVVEEAATEYELKSANYTVADGDGTIDNDTAGVTTTMLDAALVPKQVFTICNSSGGTIIVDTTSSQTMYLPGGAITTLTLLDGEAITLQSTGTNWRAL